MPDYDVLTVTDDAELTGQCQRTCDRHVLLWMSGCRHGKVKGQLSLIFWLIVMWSVFTNEQTGFNVKQEKGEENLVFGCAWNVQILSWKYLFICNRDERLPFFLDEIFGNKTCQNWSKKVKIQQIHVLFIEFAPFKKNLWPLSFLLYEN